jgi:hypothetical protein
MLALSTITAWRPSGSRRGADACAAAADYEDLVVAVLCHVLPPWLRPFISGSISRRRACPSSGVVVG